MLTRHALFAKCTDMKLYCQSLMHCAMLFPKMCVNFNPSISLSCALVLFLLLFGFFFESLVSKYAIGFKEILKESPPELKMVLIHEQLYPPILQTDAHITAGQKHLGWAGSPCNFANAYREVVYSMNG